MNKVKLRKQVYQGCDKKLYPLISQINQYITIVDPPVPISEIISYPDLRKFINEKGGLIKKWVNLALSIFSHQPLISESIGYVSPGKNKVCAVELWHLSKKEPSQSSLLTTIYTKVKGRELTYYMVQQYTPSTTTSDTLNEIYWNYLGRFGTYVPIYAAILFSTPRDVVNYPQLEEVDMISKILGMDKTKVTSLLKGRMLNHMHSIGINSIPTQSVFGKWWLEKDLFYYIKYPT